MNRLEFLTSLRYNLERGGLPREDIEDALSYYEEIFLDSGYGSDEQTAEELGSPDELAKDILRDNGIHVDGDASFEVGEAKKRRYQDVEFEEVGKENDKQSNKNTYSYGYSGAENDAANNNANGSAGYTQSSTSSGFYDAASKFGQAIDSAFTTARDSFNRNFNDPSMTATQKSKRNNNILKILIIVLSAPLWIGLLGGLFGVLVGLLAGLFSVVISLLAGGVSLVFGGVAELFSVTPVGLMMIGGGLIMLGIFGLIAKPSFKGLMKLCRLAFDGCKVLFRKLAG